MKIIERTQSTAIQAFKKCQPGTIGSVALQCLL